MLPVLLLAAAAVAAEPPSTDLPSTDLPSTDLPSTLGAVVARADSGAELRLRFAGQLLVQADVADATALSARVRRLRFGLDGKALDGKLRTALQVNLVPGATELLDAWAQVRAADGLELRAGLFKTPFTRYREQSYTSLVLSDWPVAAKAFGAERQLGLAAGDGKPGRDAWGWSLGVCSGVNSRKSFATGVAEAHGLSLSNPSDLAAGSATVTPLHPELVARLTAGTPGMDASTGFDHEGGPARALVGLSGAWDLAPEPSTDFAGRAAAEALLKAGHWSVGGVGYLGLHEGQAGSPAPGLAGATAELAWKPLPELGLAVSGSRVDVLPALRDDAAAWAQAQVDAAPVEEQAALAAALGGAGALRASTELGGGVTWFVHGTGLVVQADGAWLRADSGGVAPDGGRARVQGQVVF